MWQRTARVDARLDERPSRAIAAIAVGRQAWISARILWEAPFVVRFRGVLQALLATLLLIALVSWNPADASLNAASSLPTTNWLGANGALFASRCIGLGLHAAEARLAAALAAHGSHLAALRWYPFEVIPGGVVSVALTPHAAALDAAVRAVDEVLEQVLAQGIEQHELDAARDSLIDSLDVLRQESHSYWLGSILEHLQTGLTPKSPAGLR